MWRRRDFLAGLGALGAGQTPDGVRRSLLLIVVDGQRSEMMGCAGNRLLRTPNIDALASRSMRFENSFCAHSVCMPSRASMLTGRYPGVHGTWSNGVPLRESEVTLGRVCEEHGYETAALGKLHPRPLAEPGSQDGVTAGRSYYGFREKHLTANRPGPEFCRVRSAASGGDRRRLDRRPYPRFPGTRRARNGAVLRGRSFNSATVE